MVSFDSFLELCQLDGGSRRQALLVSLDTEMLETAAILWTDVVIAVSSAVTVVILIVAAAIAYSEIRCVAKARETQLLADLSRRWNEEQLTESRKAARAYKTGVQLRGAVQKLRENNDNEYYSLVRLPDFFEALGVLVNSGCLCKQLTRDLFGTVIEYYYGLYGPTIEYLREVHHDENIYFWFDDLAKQFKVVSSEGEH